MVKLTYTERLGLAREVLELLSKQASDLKKVGLNPDEMRRTLKEAIEENVTSNEKQESMKAALKEQTKLVNKKDRTMYMLASGYIDAMAGMLRKDSPAAEQIRRLRSKAKTGPRVKKTAAQPH